MVFSFHTSVAVRKATFLVTSFSWILWLWARIVLSNICSFVSWQNCLAQGWAQGSKDTVTWLRGCLSSTLQPFWVRLFLLGKFPFQWKWLYSIFIGSIQLFLRWWFVIFIVLIIIIINKTRGPSITDGIKRPCVYMYISNESNIPNCWIAWSRTISQDSPRLNSISIWHRYWCGIFVIAENNSKFSGLRT